jgi:hypothetical protein
MYGVIRSGHPFGEFIRRIGHKEEKFDAAAFDIENMDIEWHASLSPFFNSFNTYYFFCKLTDTEKPHPSTLANSSTSRKLCVIFI